jgi:hypothetical protein
MSFIHSQLILSPPDEYTHIFFSILFSITVYTGLSVARLQFLEFGLSTHIFP